MSKKRTNRLLVKGPIASTPAMLEMKNMLAMAKWIRLGLKVAWPLELFGVDLSSLRRATDTIPTIEKQVIESVTLPDRFNTALLEHGWVAYGCLDHEMMMKATSLAEEGKKDDAERLLVRHYDEDTLHWLIMRASMLRAMEHRTRLVRLAVKDHLAGRYHASIPVVLAQVDGLVADLSPTCDGFFSKEVDVVAWDSVAGHPTGLAALSALMRTGRRKTSNEPLKLPYRHGILHGRDCGYDDEMSSAKALATLFAVVEWAAKVERGEHLPTEESAPTLRELLQDLAAASTKGAKAKEFHKTWSPRKMQLGVTTPRSGEPDAYGPDAPERVLIEFLAAWRTRNYGKMGALVPPGRDRLPSSRRAGMVREQYEELLLEKYTLVGIKDTAACFCDIEVECHFASRSRKVLSFRASYLGDMGEPRIPGLDEGQWWFSNWMSAVGPALG